MRPPMPSVRDAVAEDRARRHALDERIDRGEDDARLRGATGPAVGEAGQRVDAPADDLGVGEARS